MTAFMAAPWMLWGLLGAGIPVAIHLMTRRRAETIDWGAMQFLDLGRRAHRRFRLAELLLMAGRMLLLALVVLAVARPSWQPGRSAEAVAQTLGGGREPRDTVVILDGSESMGLRLEGSSPRDMALAWSRSFAERMRPSDSIAVLMAKDRVRNLTDGLSYDRAKIVERLHDTPSARGSSDLPSAIAEAFLVLESGRNAVTEIVILTDGQRLPWRPGEPRRWDLLRGLRDGLKGRAPRIATVFFGDGAKAEGADAAVSPIALTRGVYAPDATIAMNAVVTNAGPGSASRRVELLVDGVGVPGADQAVGPIPPGGKAPLIFVARIASPGSHRVGIRLSGGDDPLAANDLAERTVEIAEALPVLLVDGEPGAETFASESVFVRAALAPAGDEAPAILARVVPVENMDAHAVEGQRVLVLLNVERLDPSQVSAVARFLETGGGVLIAPGDRVDEIFYNMLFFADGRGILPSRMGERKGNPDRRDEAAHLAPRSFVGPALGPFDEGESPPLANASIFYYHMLIPATGDPAATVLAHLDTGDPWAVERPYREGRVILLAGPLDAEGGTLPVNPDFVPMVHEIIYRLADSETNRRPNLPGEPIVVDLAEPPMPGNTTASVTRPDGSTADEAIVREGDKARVRIASTNEPGIYEVDLPGPSGGTAYASVAADAHEADPDRLAPAEAEALAEGWPMTFAQDPRALDLRLATATGGGPRPLWRGLVLAALGGLCLEVFLTRSMVKARGQAPPMEAEA